MKMLPLLTNGMYLCLKSWCKVGQKNVFQMYCQSLNPKPYTHYPSIHQVTFVVTYVLETQKKYGFCVYRMHSRLTISSPNICIRDEHMNQGFILALKLNQACKKLHSTKAPYVPFVLHFGLSSLNLLLFLSCFFLLHKLIVIKLLLVLISFLK